MATTRICGPTHVLMLLMAGGLAALGGGCSGDSTPTAPVSGKVTLDGKPLANISVLFQPAGGANRDPGAGSVGITDAQGMFTLKISGSGKLGAVVGLHAVTLMEKTNPADDQDAGGTDKPVVSRIPAEFSNGSQKFEVKSDGLNQVNFDLKSPST